MAKTQTAESADGRRMRSERSRQAIIDAALYLMNQGNLIPTAQAIAEQAGVGIRSFFRHFADMDTLFAAVDEQSRDEVEARFLGGDRDGSLEQRIQHAVERHADGYEAETNTILSTSAQLWRSEVLRKNYARYQRGLRKDLNDWLPELKTLSRSQREAVDAIASFEMWYRLRYHQGLGKSASIVLVVELLQALIQQ
ncbi:MAG: helix-turn-helix domain-containing protein [Halioglobus sp.]